MILGIILIRFAALPVLGVVIIKAARDFGMVGSDPLYHFVLLLQYSVPPAMAIGMVYRLLFNFLPLKLLDLFHFMSACGFNC
mgnify:CR=1 FL=1